MPVYVVMLGAPGAGKGTQAKMLCDTAGLPHISSGDLFRENIKNQTELGKQVDAILARGELVPDDITIAMIKDRLARPDCEKGAVLDGFPRTVAQAEALDGLLADLNQRVDVVPFIKVDPEVLISRLTGRWTCRGPAGHIFHQEFSPPKEPGICDYDGSTLYQRDDDKEETVKNRIEVYFEKTAPVIEYYRSTGVLKEVNGDQSIEAVAAALMEIVPSKAEL